MEVAGLPALQSGELGQVRKEAATAGLCKCRGSGSPLILFTDELSSTCPQMAAAGLRQPGGARARRPGVAARARAKTAASRVPVRRYAGGRQDDSRAHPGEMPQLRNRRDTAALRQV